MSESSTPATSSAVRRDLTWPLLITAGLLLVVLVNIGFIWVALDGQDPVVESYMTEAR